MLEEHNSIRPADLLVTLRALLERTARKLKNKVGLVLRISVNLKRNEELVISIYSSEEGILSQLLTAATTESMLESLIRHNSVGRAILPETIGPFLAGRDIVVKCSKHPALECFLLLGAKATWSEDAERVLLEEFTNAVEGIFERYSMCAFAASTGVKIHDVGLSERFVRLQNDLKRLAAYPDAPVLILGERGSGKEAAAYAIHYFSPRRNHPFLPVNAGLLHPEVYASDLFGACRGAFTGASQDRKGKFECADRGTIFFDEITECPPAVFPGLLRAVETGEVQGLGMSRPRRANVRIIASTNKNIEELVRSNAFPVDLFDRLSALIVRVPPLREHPDDIPVLAEYFAAITCRSISREEQDGLCSACREQCHARCVTSTFISSLLAYHWPGNIRELRNAIVRASTNWADGELHSEWAPGAIDTKCGTSPLSSNSSSTLDEVLKSYIAAVLQKTGGNKSAAARALGIPITTLISKMKRLGLGSSKSRAGGRGSSNGKGENNGSLVA